MLSIDLMLSTELYELIYEQFIGICISASDPCKTTSLFKYFKAMQRRWKYKINLK